MNELWARPSALSHEHAKSTLVLVAPCIEKATKSSSWQSYLYSYISCINEQALDAVGCFSEKDLRPWKNVCLLKSTSKSQTNQNMSFLCVCLNGFGIMVSGNSIVCSKNIPD